MIIPVKIKEWNSLRIFFINFNSFIQIYLKRYSWLFDHIQCLQTSFFTVGSLRFLRVFLDYDEVRKQDTAASWHILQKPRVVYDDIFKTAKNE
jgi:hypothetical protein